MFTIDINRINAYEKEIEDTNTKLYDLINKGEVANLESVEFLKIVHSGILLEDLKFLCKHSGEQDFECRYADAILRNMVDQVIEFIYLVQNPTLIPNYMSKNYAENPPKENDTAQELISKFKSLSGSRFGSKRKNVADMAAAINEKESVTDRLSLYDMFTIFSETNHNSYFIKIISMVGATETDEEETALTEFQANQLCILFERFMKEYRK